MFYYLDNCENFNTKKTNKPQFQLKYRYWVNWLFLFMAKLFTWENIDFSQKEIESRLIFNGFCGFNYVKGELIPVDANLFGITDFYDEFTNYNWVTPKNNGTCVIGLDGIIIENTPFRMSAYPIIDRYATLLAHTEITFINALVNGRANKTYVANTDKVAENVRKYVNGLYDGKINPIVDNSFNAIQILQNDEKSLERVKDIYDTLNNILVSFYEEIGVRKNTEKKERQITNEITSNDGLLKLNIKDMFESRLKACEDINNMFGTNITVKCNVDIDGDNIVEDKGELE